MCSLERLPDNLVYVGRRILTEYRGQARSIHPESVSVHVIWQGFQHFLRAGHHLIVDNTDTEYLILCH